MTFTLNKFYVAVSNSLEGDAFTRKINYLTFDLGVNVTQNIPNYPLHYVIYASAKFEVAKSNDLVRDAITRNVTDGRTYGWTYNDMYKVYSYDIPH